VPDKRERVNNNEKTKTYGHAQRKLANKQRSIKLKDPVHNCCILSQSYARMLDLIV